jgi:hypothetical protein
MKDRNHIPNMHNRIIGPTWVKITYTKWQGGKKQNELRKLPSSKCDGLRKISLQKYEGPTRVSTSRLIFVIKTFDSETKQK